MIMKASFSGVVALVVVGLVFHFVYLLSIFDIYFRSPIVHGMPPYAVPLEPPANRLVLFVADGLRADKFYETIPGSTASAPITRAPFLRSIIEKSGTWGVSHTRVPTETRPGHVALIAGLYEDVSAVTEGWKHNPVEFDSVFNRSSATFGYGSPDVVPMFSQGSEHIYFETYESDAENFANDAAHLDQWVLDKTHALLDKMKNDPQFAKKLQGPGAVLFLHLLAIDTFGHAYRPFASEYLDQIYRLDQGIKKVYDTIESLFPDKKTTYVFTSDHGMSNKGNHGDGEKANTETPLVCWGAGIDKPRRQVASRTSGADDNYDMDKDKRIRSHNERTPAGWMLDDLVRRDVNQADIAPLMASLLGLPCPVNSVGVLPLAHLPPDDLYSSTALFYNAKQVLAQYLYKATSRQEASLKALYQPFHPLDHHADLVREIEAHLLSRDYAKANAVSHDLIDLALQGLHYYQVYDWPFIMTVVTSGYLGWIATVLIYTINTYTTHGHAADLSRGAMPGSTAVLAIPSRGLALRVLAPLGFGFGFLFLQQSPGMYYLYLLFPVLFWGWSLGHLGPTLRYLRTFGKSTKDGAIPAPSTSTSLALTGMLAFLCMQCSVVGYFYREVFVLALFGVAMWTASGMTAAAQKAAGGDVLVVFAKGARYLSLRQLWWISCILVGIFPLIPLDFGASVPLVILGALFVTTAGVIVLLHPPTNGTHRPTRATQLALTILVVLATVLVVASTHSLTLKQGLPYVNQVLAWGSLAVSLVCVFGYPRTHESVMEGLACLYLGVAPSFVLLSIAYEVLFYAALALHLFAWVMVELQFFSSTSVSASVTALRTHTKGPEVFNSVTVHDARRAVIYIVLCYVAMFGTGNVASISSFEISSTYRFVTVFSPFVMTSLLLWKLTAPILIVSCVYFGLTKLLRVPRPAVFLLVVGFADIMTLDFFYLVRDEGSWQEIGVSIGHFAISNTFIILQLILFSLSSLILRLPTSASRTSSKNTTAHAKVSPLTTAPTPTSTTTTVSPTTTTLATPSAGITVRADDTTPAVRTTRLRTKTQMA